LAENYKGFEGTHVLEEVFFQALRKDKKNTGKDLSLVLLRGPGKVFLQKHPFDNTFMQMGREYLAGLKERMIS